MNRRGFLGACFLAAAAPAIVRADSLMRIIPKRTVLLPTWGASVIEMVRDRQAMINVLYGALLTPDGNVIAAFDMRTPIIEEGVATFGAIEAQAKRAGFASSLRITNAHGIQLVEMNLAEPKHVVVGDIARLNPKVSYT